MIATIIKPQMTPEQFLEMPDTAHFELVDGHLVERKVSTLSSRVEGIVFRKVDGHADQHKLGIAWPGTLGIKCFPSHPRKVRRPDLSFVKAARITADIYETGFLLIAPDLAVEVISPGDLAHEVAEKIEEFRQIDVSLIWIIEPELRIVDVYRKSGVNSRLREGDELLGEDVLPGFRCKVAELFPEIPPSSGS